MNEERILGFLAFGTAAGALGIAGWFVLNIRPRSLAFRFTGASMTAAAALALILLQPVVSALEQASLAHAAVDSEGGTFVYGFTAELIVFAGAILLIPGSILWGIGIQRHPDPVSTIERSLQITALALPLVYLAWRCVAA